MIHRSRHGFTVLELMVVIVIIGIMSAIAFPRLQSARDRRDSNAARREMTAQVERARALATERGCTATVNMTTGANTRSWLTTCTTAGTGVDTVGGFTSIGPRYGVNMTSTATTVDFSPIGVSVGGTATTMIFTKGSRADTLLVTALGRPQW